MFLLDLNDLSLLRETLQRSGVAVSQKDIILSDQSPDTADRQSLIILDVSVKLGNLLTSDQKLPLHHDVNRNRRGALFVHQLLMGVLDLLDQHYEGLNDLSSLLGEAGQRTQKVKECLLVLKLLSAQERLEIFGVQDCPVSVRLRENMASSRIILLS